MRVASRRLRAAQAVFDPLLFRKRSEPWETGIKKVTRSLGAARDLDIQIETIRRFRLMVEDPRCQPGANRLFLRLLQTRVSAQKKVIRVVKEFSSDKVIKQFESRLQKLAPAEGYTPTPDPLLLKLSAESALQKLDILLGFQPFVDHPESILELHDMRIAAKRLRYTLELFAPLYKDGFKSWLKSLKEIQDLLGYMHDCDVWIEFIPEFVEDEKKLTKDYFGNLTGFKKILPGIEVFLENRGSDRKRRFQEFNLVWHRLEGKSTWEKLRDRLEKNLPSSNPVSQELMVEETPIADQEIEDQSPEQVLDNLQELIVEGKDENSGNQ
jgi:CHAD domain-containing protein